MDQTEPPSSTDTAPMYPGYLNAEQAKRLHDAADKARRRHPFARRRIQIVEEAATKHVGEGVPDEIVNVLVESMAGGMKESKQAKQAHRRASRRR